MSQNTKKREETIQTRGKPKKKSEEGKRHEWKGPERKLLLPIVGGEQQISQKRREKKNAINAPKKQKKKQPPPRQMLGAETGGEKTARTFQKRKKNN